MNEQLKHIFDESTCLTRRQMKDYVSGTMGAEECHAAEHHINSCPFCSEAIDGMSVNPEEAILAVNELDTAFLRTHFHRHTPQVHLNSLAPAAQPADYGYTKTKAQKNKAKASLRNTSIAVIVLLCIALIWYLGFGKNKIVQHSAQQQAAPAPVVNVSSQTTNAAQNVSAQTTNKTVSPAAKSPKEDNQQKLQPLVFTGKKTSVKHIPAKHTLKLTMDTSDADAYQPIAKESVTADQEKH